MKIKAKGHYFGSALVLLATGTLVGKTLAQPIVPANDGTGTTVTPAGNRYDISGGKTSGDGKNLFHRFQKFGLSNEQIANFLSNPNIHNILTRIIGGEPSLINGLITVTGGNPNLFLINPAGIVFGPSATLNVPASFTATTATSIGFNSGLLRAFGKNDYASLVGDPLAFDFASIPSGSILNLGNLTAGKDLNLLGGTVLSTGTLSAPQGNITIATVSGTNRIRISQTGQVLSLELPAIASIEPAQISPLTLPELLTGTPLGHATQIIVTEAGEVRLTGMTSPLNAQTEVPVKPGDIAIAGNPLSLSHRPLLSTGSATLSAAQTLTLTTGTLESTGNLNLLAGDTIRVRDSLNQPFSARTGGALTLQGNLGIDILALNHPQAALQAGQNLSLISDGAISGDAHFLSGGDVSIINLNGEFGNFLSLYDPIIRATGNVNFGNYTGTSLKVEATGEIVAGNINITGPDTALPDASDPDAAILSSSAALILRSGVPVLGGVANVPPNQTSGGTAFVPSAPPLGNGITVGEISTAGGPAILQAAGEITIDTLATAGGNADFTAVADITVLGAINTGNNGGNSGSVNLNSIRDIDLSAIDTQGVGDFGGGEVNLQAGNFLRVGNGFRDGNNRNASISSADAFGGGNINIHHAGGRTTPFVVGDGATNGTAAAITTGSSLISPRFEVPVPPTGVYRQGNITISTNGFNRSSRLSEFPSERSSNIASDLAGRDVLLQRNIIQPQESEIQTKLRTVSRVDIAKAIDNLEIPEAILFIDILFTEEVGYYIQQNIKREVQSFKQVQEKIAPIAAETGLKPAIIYTFSRPEQLDLILVPPQGLPIHKSVSAAKGDILLQKLKTFREEITNPLLRRNQNYKQSAMQLYQWIVAPLESDLQALEIDTLVFAMDAGLRSLPLAALYDGEQFLVEKYNLGLIPSVNLTNMNYSSLKEAQVLAMGISEFKEFSELPAVPVEIKTVTSLRQGEALLNPESTFNNLKSQRQAKLYQILHLATHAEFQPGEAKNSYIQLWDSQLSFDQLRELKWNDPLVELLVLSACRTAMGDEQVELGFAGLAVRTGVKSAIASLWYVSDEGTLGLMSEFYKHLNEFPTKAEALRRAQIAMLKGEVRREQNRLLLNSGEEIALPAQPGNFKEPMFSHPFYWAGFTIVGNPW